MLPIRQKAIDTSRITFKMRSPLSLPYLMRLPEESDPAIAPKLVTDVIAVVQNYSVDSSQSLIAENVISRFPHDASPYPN